MRVTTAFCKLLRLQGVRVTDVRFTAEAVVVEVALRRRRLCCPHCDFSTRARKDMRPERSVWRHLDLGTWRLLVSCQRRRLICPRHGACTEAVPFARAGSWFTRDFECLVAWLAARVDKQAVTRLCRIDWDTVGRIIKRVCADELDRARLEGLYDIGVDEVSWRKQHKYLTLVVDHHRRQVVWGTEGAGAAAADEFFADLDPEHTQLRDFAHEVKRDLDLDLLDGQPFPPGPRASRLHAISLDMGPGYAKSAREHAPQAIICIDPYHVVALANRALDEVRRSYWNQLRDLGDQQAARRFKDARWSLLKAPENLTGQQASTLKELKRAGGDAWRGYTLKEATRAIFAPELTPEDVTILLRRLCSRLARSRLEPFVRLGRTLKKHRDGILAAIRLGINQGRTEALNNKVRLITRRAYGFHSAQAALALIMLTCGPINLDLPHDQHPQPVSLL